MDGLGTDGRRSRCVCDDRDVLGSCWLYGRFEVGGCFTA